LSTKSLTCVEKKEGIYNIFFKLNWQLLMAFSLNLNKTVIKFS
jgi:hypothetical protein